MPIDWSGLERKYKKWFSDIAIENEGTDNAKIKKTPAKTAKYIATEYEKAVKKGKEQYMNGPMVVQKAILQSAVEKALKLMAKDTTGAAKAPAAMIIATGLVGFWTGGMMKMDVPPPPSFKPISNVVLFPGAPIPPKVAGPNEDAGTLGGALVKAMKSHAGTISGLCTSLTVVGTASPPLPYPWVGVK